MSLLWVIVAVRETFRLQTHSPARESSSVLTKAKTFQNFTVQLIKELALEIT
jgi:hypothetical protein